jgi:DNA-binding response OmpR family regulator
MSKDHLLETVWGYEASDTNSNIVELAIRRLRKKLEDDPSRPKRLVTVRGVGYKFCDQDADPSSSKGMQLGEAQHRRPPADHW